MKNGIVLALIFIFSCDTNTIDNSDKDDGRISINIELKNLTFDKGITSHEINLENVFHFEDKQDKDIKITIDSAVNNNLLNVDLVDNLLSITFVKDSTGSSRIKLKASKDGSEKVVGFKVIVNEIVSVEYITKGKNSYDLGNYSESKTFFEQAIAQNDSRYLPQAYLGLGFVELKLESYAASFNAMNYGYQNFKSSPELQGFKAGLSFLNFSYKKNYSKAISLGLEVLLNNHTFQLTFDQSIDYKDIRLNVALSQFALQQFIPCYDSIRELDSSFTLESSDPEFIKKLDAKLVSLITELL